MQGSAIGTAKTCLVLIIVNDLIVGIGCRSRNHKNSPRKFQLIATKRSLGRQERQNVREMKARNEENGNGIYRIQVNAVSIFPSPPPPPS